MRWMDLPSPYPPFFRIRLSSPFRRSATSSPVRNSRSQSAVIFEWYFTDVLADSHLTRFLRILHWFVTVADPFCPLLRCLEHLPALALRELRQFKHTTWALAANLTVFMDGSIPTTSSLIPMVQINPSGGISSFLSNKNFKTLKRVFYVPVGGDFIGEYCKYSPVGSSLTPLFIDGWTDQSHRLLFTWSPTPALVSQ